MSKQRLIWLDALKGVLILLVVLGHAIQYTLPADSCENNYWWNLIYSFHMPAFMAASGFVNFRPNVTWGGVTLCKRRTYQLLIPFLLWSFIKWLISSNHTLQSLMNLTFTNGGFFWFLWALWVISLISIGCNWFTYKFNIRQEIVYGITIIALAFAMIILNIRVLGFQYIAYYFIFYSIGYFTNKYKNLLTTNRVYLSLCFAVWLLMASFWNMHTLPWFLLHIPYIPHTILQYLYRFATAIVAIYFLFSIFPIYFNRLNIGNFILRLGRNSLAVYGLQGIIIYYVCVWVANLWPSMSAGISVIIAFIATTALCMLGVNIGKRNKLSSRLLFGKL